MDSDKVQFSLPLSKNAFFGQKMIFFLKFILNKNDQQPKIYFFSGSKTFFSFFILPYYIVSMTHCENKTHIYDLRGIGVHQCQVYYRNVIRTRGGQIELQIELH